MNPSLENVEIRCVCSVRLIGRLETEKPPVKGVRVGGVASRGSQEKSWVAIRLNGLVIHSTYIRANIIPDRTVGHLVPYGDRSVVIYAW